MEHIVPMHILPFLPMRDALSTAIANRSSYEAYCKAMWLELFVRRLSSTLSKHAWIATDRGHAFSLGNRHTVTQWTPLGKEVPFGQCSQPHMDAIRTVIVDVMAVHDCFQTTVDPLQVELNHEAIEHTARNLVESLHVPDVTFVFHVATPKCSHPWNMRFHTST